MEFELIYIITAISITAFLVLFFIVRKINADIYSKRLEAYKNLKRGDLIICNINNENITCRVVLRTKRNFFKVIPIQNKYSLHLISFISFVKVK